MPIVRALRVLCQGGPKALEVCLETVESGGSLPKAMEKSQLFTPYQISAMVVANEAGTVPAALGKLSEQELKRVALRDSLVSKLTYPAFLCVTSVALTLVLLLVMRPVMEVAASLAPPPPWLATVLTVLDVRWFLLAGVLLALGCLALALVWASKGYRYSLEKILFRWRGLEFLRIAPTVAVARHIADLLEAGVPLAQGLRLMLTSTPSPFLKTILEIVTRSLEDGASLHKALEGTGFFPEIFLQFVSTGEESGTLPRCLQSYVRHAETEFDTLIERMVALLQPAIMTVQGVICGGAALLGLWPVYQVLRSL